MNSSIKITELKNRYYLFYFHDGKPKLLKKDSESQLLGSMSRLKHKGIDAYIGIDLLTLNIISYNYQECSITDGIEEPYMIIVKTSDSIIFHNVDGRPFYDEPVLLSCGNFILVKKKKKKYVRYVK